MHNRKVQPAARVYLGGVERKLVGVGPRIRETLAELNAQATSYGPHPTLDGMWEAFDTYGELLCVLDEQTLFELNGWTRSPQAVLEDLEMFGATRPRPGGPLPAHPHEALVRADAPDRWWRKVQRAWPYAAGFVATLVIWYGLVMWMGGEG